ncbi:hypothetical protein JTB14_005233 [Gonioctena quinquepunctata]|nr:hypothetical protein JTB14_005233 [Gonioctena quinquepunctata]
MAMSSPNLENFGKEIQNKINNNVQEFVFNTAMEELGPGRQEEIADIFIGLQITNTITLSPTKIRESQNEKENDFQTPKKTLRNRITPGNKDPVETKNPIHSNQGHYHRRND